MYNKQVCLHEEFGAVASAKAANVAKTEVELWSVWSSPGSAFITERRYITFMVTERKLSIALNINKEIIIHSY